MKITVSQLLRAYPQTNRQRATEFVEVFNQWNGRFGINTIPRLVHFLAQVLCESAALTRVEENLNYSACRLLQVFPKYFNSETAQEYAHNPEKIASRVYANRYGNGNEASCDGWKYKGRGFIQLTFKDNYKSYQNSGFCIGDLLSHPEWLAKSPGHTKSAMWFWWKNGLSALADMDNGDGKKGEDVVKQITRKINGGYTGLADRLFYYRRLRKEFGL